MKNLFIKILFIAAIGAGLYSGPLLVTEISQRMGWIAVPTDDQWDRFKTEVLTSAVIFSMAMIFLLVCYPEPDDEGDQK